MIPLTDSEIQYLLKTPLFTGFSSDELSSLLSCLRAEKKAYKKGEALHQSGTPLRRFGLVLSGAVQACHDDLSGRRFIMAEVNRGQTFGESLAYLEIPDSSVYITAAKDCAVLWVEVPRFSIPAPGCSEELGKRFFHRFTSLLAGRTLAMNTRIQILSRPRLREKILLFLQNRAELTGSRDILLSMNRDDLASYIGTDRSALSRELSRMKKDGLIDYYKNSFRLL